MKLAYGSVKLVIFRCWVGVGVVVILMVEGGFASGQEEGVFLVESPRVTAVKRKIVFLHLDNKMRVKGIHLEKTDN
jgi:hypothetical protein